MIEYVRLDTFISAPAPLLASSSGIVSEIIDFANLTSAGGALYLRGGA